MDADNKHIDIALLTRFLAGQVTVEEHEYVTLWKEASAENLQEFNEFEKVWTSMDKTLPGNRIDVDAEWELHLSKYNPLAGKATRTISMRTVFSIAASVLLLLGLSVLGWQYLSGTNIKTNPTETAQITLPDGSQVTLNAESKLTYKSSFGKDMRRVTLEGEAYFEVAKNPLSPFVIALDGGAEVKVLGTRFNVKAYKNKATIDVTVTEGKVCVYEKGNESKKIILEKDENGTYNKSAHEVLKQALVDRNYIAWKTHTMVFENENLKNIAEMLSNVYHKDIIIDNPSLEHCTITTSFDNQTLDSVLKILSETIDMVVEEREGKIHISGKGC